MFSIIKKRIKLDGRRLVITTLFHSLVDLGPGASLRTPQLPLVNPQKKEGRGDEE